MTTKYCEHQKTYPSHGVGSTFFSLGNTNIRRTLFLLLESFCLSSSLANIKRLASHSGHSNLVQPRLSNTPNILDPSVKEEFIWKHPHHLSTRSRRRQQDWSSGGKPPAYLARDSSFFTLSNRIGTVMRNTHRGHLGLFFNEFQTLRALGPSMYQT